MARKTKQEVVVETTTIEPKKTQKRAFNAAIINRLTSDWLGTNSINQDLQGGLKTMRRRARDLSINNEFAVRYLSLIKGNVVGPDGVTISVQATNIDGTPDPMSDRIETLFAMWCLPENCTVKGTMNFVKAQEVVLETVARDGECLVWLRRGAEFGDFSFQIQILDPSHLDENFYSTTPDGNTVFQGVELNPFGKPIAYYLWEVNPDDTSLLTAQRSNKRIRVAATDLLHIFDPEQASQVRGYSWLAPCMVSLNHIAKYRESELIAARTAAEKRFYFKQEDNVGFQGDDEPDDAGNVTFESNPGAFEILPKGWDVKTVDWNSPNQGLAEFQKVILRSVAASLGVSYNSLASDLESVNYSSARFGSLEDQNSYRSLQNFFINAFVRPVFSEWLKIQLLTNTSGLNIPFNKFNKFNNVRYIAKTWQSIDRTKDSRADAEELANSLTSWSDVIQKSGRDPEQVFLSIAKDKRRMQELGITPVDVQVKLTAIANDTQMGLDANGTSNTNKNG